MKVILCHVGRWFSMGLSCLFVSFLNKQRNKKKKMVARVTVFLCSFVCIGDNPGQQQQCLPLEKRAGLLTALEVRDSVLL